MLPEDTVVFEQKQIRSPEVMGLKLNRWTNRQRIVVIAVTAQKAGPRAWRHLTADLWSSPGVTGVPGTMTFELRREGMRGRQVGLVRLVEALYISVRWWWFLPLTENQCKAIEGF